MKILRAEKISLNLDGRQILKNLSLEVEEGSIHSILGTNAAGKSSLAYCLMGCCNYIPQSGKIYFDGADITDLPVYKRAQAGMTLAWQEPARFEGLTVGDYISAGMKKNDRRLIEKSLALVSLDAGSYLNREVDKRLSGGERKRIELAAVFAMQPKLVIMDEPDSGIDILALDSIVGLIKEMRNRGTTVLLITHREEVSEIADRTSLMCSGFIVKEGSPSEVGKYFRGKCVPCPTKNYPDGLSEDKKK